MAIHYCGHPYTGPKNHLMDNSQATFMDLYCHNSYTDTTFINQNSYADVLLQKIQDIKDAYTKWKKENPDKKVP